MNEWMPSGPTKSQQLRPRDRVQGQKCHMEIWPPLPSTEAKVPLCGVSGSALSQAPTRPGPSRQAHPLVAASSDDKQVSQTGLRSQAELIHAGGFSGESVRMFTAVRLQERRILGGRAGEPPPSGILEAHMPYFVQPA